MTVQTYEFTRTRHGLVNKAVDWLADTFQEIGESRARAAMAAELSRLDDRTLADIGFSRSEIGSLVANPADPTRIHR